MAFIISAFGPTEPRDTDARRVTKADVIAAIRAASAGPVAEGCVGAGTGTRAFDWKGGIGTVRESCRSRWAATLSAFWCRPITAAC